MADREVTAVRRDGRGRTVALANPDSSWSPVQAHHAAGQIDAKLHRYYTRRGNDSAWIHVVHDEDGTYLRTMRDSTTSDNLDDLPLDTSVNPLAGDFDVLLQLSDDSVTTALRAMHASGALTHRAGLVTNTHAAVIVLGAQELRVDGDAATAVVRMPFQCWVRPLKHLDDPGDCATGVIEAPVALYTTVEGDDAVSLATDWSAVAAASVAVDHAPSSVQEIVRSVVVAWARSSGGRYRVPTNAFGQPVSIGVRFAQSPGGVACAQVGIDVEESPGVAFPAPSEQELQLTLSGRWITRRVLESLRSELGELPPPYGAGDIAMGGGAVLTALDVEMVDAGLQLHGQMRAGVVSASFSVAVALVGNTPRTVRAVVGDVDVEVDDLFSQIVDFFSAGTLRRALADGVRAAVEGGGAGGVSDLLSRATLRAAAALGSAAAVRLDAEINQISFTRHGVALAGRLTSGAAPAVKAVVSVSELPGRWRLAVALDSWAPGDAISSVTYDFGDGDTITLAGADVALAVPHEYSPGRWRATVSVTDTAGRSRVASSRVIRVPQN